MKNHGVSQLPNRRIDKTVEAPICVLCVDDEAEFIESAKQLLELETSFHVDLAYSVKDALEKMASKVFDIIVSDYQMPGKNGLDFLKELRDSGNDIPFILFTGKGREEVAVKALNLGAARYFNKFGNPETVYCELVHGIRQAVAQRQVEKEIWDREERLRAIVASSPDAMIITDLHGIITDCNLETLKLLEASSMSEVIGKHYQTLLTKEEQEKIGFAVKELFETGFLANPESRVLTKSGSEIAIEFSANTLRDAYGKPVGAIALARNISDRKKSEATLQQSESKFRSFFENSPDYCYIISPKGEILEINKSALEGLGYSKKELLGKSFLTTIYAPSSQKKVRKLIENWKLTGKIQNKELEIVTKQGEKRDVLLGGHSVCDVDGRLLHYVGVQIDVTEHKKADEALKNSEEKYRSIVELCPDGIMTVNMRGTVTSVNRAFLELTGFSEDEIVGKHITKLGTIRAKDIPRYIKMFYSVLRGKKMGPIEFDYLRKDGTQLFGEARLSLMKEKGKKIGAQAILVDITERKKIEQDLKDSEEKYRTVVEQAPDSIMTFDLNGVITSCNATSVAMTGYSKEELVGKHFSELESLNEEQIKKFTKMIPYLSEEAIPEPFEIARINEEGHSFFGEVHVSLMKQGKKVTGFQTITRDITEHKKAEEALRESEKRFRELSELLPEVIFETDNKGVLKFVNHAAYTRFGYSQEEFEAGLHALQMIAPEDRDRAKENIRKVMSGETLGSNEYNALTKDGTTFPMIINSTPVLRGDKIVGMRGLMVDITERKKAEDELKDTLKKMETLNEKLSVIGKLTRHDARNKLSVIANNAYLAKNQLTQDHAAISNLNSIETSIDQIEKILEFSRVYEMLGTEELSYIDVKKSFVEAVMLLSCPENIKLVTKCEGLKVRADSSLRQIFYNLIDNSMKHGEKVSQIKVYCKERKDGFKIVYEDDGVGIPEDEKERIFAKGYGKGTGYGLYLIKKICASYNWSIQETSNIGEGAKFVITIPKLNKNGKPNYTLKTE
jgi:PAS domain S-box-containing protein